MRFTLSCSYDEKSGSGHIFHKSGKNPAAVGFGKSKSGTTLLVGLLTSEATQGELQRSTVFLKW